MKFIVCIADERLKIKYTKCLAKVLQSINQLINQSVSQSVSPSVSPSVRQSVSQSINLSFIYLIYQSINQSHDCKKTDCSTD